MNISGKILFFCSLLQFSICANSQNVAPDFILTDTHGVSRNLYTELDAGKTVVLDFFITNCGTCQVNTAVLESLWQTYGHQGDSVWVWGIEVSGVPDSAIDAFSNQFGATYPSFNTTFDDIVEVAYNITYTPQYYVVCPAGYMKQIPIGDIEQSILDCPEITTLNENALKTNKKWFYSDKYEIHFEISGDYFPVKADVYSSVSKLVNSIVVNDNTSVLQISDLKPGIYFIVAHDINGKSLTGKFIK
jgi:ferredoxin-like protein FixX